MASAPQESRLKAIRQPKNDWLQIARAVFSLYGAGRLWDADTIADLGSLTSRHEGSRRPNNADLCELLKSNTKARSAEIDLEATSFRFTFHTKATGAACVGGPPWELIKEVKKGARKRRAADSKAVVGSGFKIVRKVDPAAISQHRLIRAAASLVWHQYMLRDFDRAVAAGTVNIWARVGHLQSGFSALAPDIWPLLTIVDWVNGVAIGPNDAVYYSLHGSRASTVVAIARNEKMAVEALAKKLRSEPDLRRADAVAFCQSVAPVTPRGFQDRIWPQARERAGLSARANSGRKRKSSH